MLNYAEMVADARKKGLATENAMWNAIEAVDDMLDELEDESVKDKFMRRQYESLFGPHYNETFAEADISRLSWNDANGMPHHGAHWTRDEVESAMADKVIPQGTTPCDMWVAANVMYSDLCNDFDDKQILTAAYDFFIDDKDAPEGKIWQYMKAMH